MLAVFSALQRTVLNKREICVDLRHAGAPNGANAPYAETELAGDAERLRSERRGRLEREEVYRLNDGERERDEQQQEESDEEEERAEHRHDAVPPQSLVRVRMFFVHGLY